MAYDLAKINMTALMRPAFDAGIALTRLDGRIARSPVGSGWIERQNFADACASLWIDGELVHLEDLVLHDATRDIRTPTHELTIARDVLRTRRRIAGQSADWALSAEGIRTLRQMPDITSSGAGAMESVGNIQRAAVIEPEGEGQDEGNAENLPGVDYAAIDATLARSSAAIENATRPGGAGGRAAAEKDPMIYDLGEHEDLWGGMERSMSSSLNFGGASGREEGKTNNENSRWPTCCRLIAAPTPPQSGSMRCAPRAGSSGN